MDCIGTPLDGQRTKWLGLVNRGGAGWSKSETRGISINRRWRFFLPVPLSYLLLRDVNARNILAIFLGNLFLFTLENFLDIYLEFGQQNACPNFVNTGIKIEVYFYRFQPLKTECCSGKHKLCMQIYTRFGLSWEYGKVQVKFCFMRYINFQNRFKFIIFLRIELPAKFVRIEIYFLKICGVRLIVD